MGKVRVWIKQGCFLQHGYQVLHDSKHGKAVVLQANSLRPIFGSGLGSKQKAHGCASSIVGMVMLAAIEGCCDARMTFWQVVNESAEGCAKEHMLGCLGWVEVKVGGRTKLENGR